MRWMTLLAVTAVLALAGCGGSDEKSSSSSGSSSSSNSSSSSGGGGETLKLAADKSALKFDKTSLTAPAGKVTIQMSNPSMLSHNVAIEGNGLDTAGQIVSNGGTSTVTANLKAGKYTFFCAVDGHRAAGMQGTLTITG